MKNFVFFLILAGGFFISLVAINGIAKLNIEFIDIAGSSVIFGVLGAYFLYIYGRYYRIKNKLNKST